MPYDMALASLLDSMMFEKTIKAVATNIGDMNKAVGGWDFTSSPKSTPSTTSVTETRENSTAAGGMTTVGVDPDLWCR